MPCILTCWEAAKPPVAKANEGLGGGSWSPSGQWRRSLCSWTMSRSSDELNLGAKEVGCSRTWRCWGRRWVTVSTWTGGEGLSDERRSGTGPRTACDGRAGVWVGDVWAMLVGRECRGGDVGIETSIWFGLFVLMEGEVVMDNDGGGRPLV